MTNFFIFHGVGGHPGENWFPWIKQELAALGHTVIVPQFPTPENQILKNWLAVIDQYRDQLENSVLIGHSLGVPFALNVIEQYPEMKFNTAYLVAGFTGLIGNELDPGLKTFAQRDFNWPLIKQSCKKFFIFHSNNDPYVKLEKAKGLAQNLNTEVILIKGGGHLNQSAGYTKFELLLEKILNEL